MILADAVLSLRNAIVAVNVAAATFLLGIAYAALRERRRRPVRPLNKLPYLDDEGLEGPRLNRMLAWALGSMAVIAISLPAYWMIEPTRQELAEENLFRERSAEKGALLFAPAGENPVALGCAGCHGARGEGGAAVTTVEVDRADLRVAEGALNDPDRICSPIAEKPDKLICKVVWEAPALNTVFQRFSREEITDIITFGRPGTPMPAWGLAGGGPKNEQSIENIVNFLETIQIDADEAKAKQRDLVDVKALFEANCARCHTKHWSYRDTFLQRDDVDVLVVPGGGAFGPNLTGGVTLRQFPDIEDHIEFIATGSDFQKPYGTRGIGSGRMPGFAGMLTREQIEAIVAYERSLEEASKVPLKDLVGKAGSAGAGSRRGGEG